MGTFILSTLVSAGAFFLGARLIEGIRIKSFVHAVIIALVIALLNATLGWLLQVFTPDKILNFLTFGLYQIVLDAIVIFAGSILLDELEIKGFIPAFLLALFVAVSSSIGCWLISCGCN